MLGLLNKYMLAIYAANAMWEVPLLESKKQRLIKIELVNKIIVMCKQ